MAYIEGLEGLKHRIFAIKETEKIRGIFRRRGKRELMGIDNLGKACDVKCCALKGSNTNGLRR